ncbi:hypothetical protein [Bosea sp. BIWAKO-01]|uniref:hypothetical protein n=1 Tax=Bosea sp. BIWAKO-01 TaxID=506668 RepID=UPI000852E834|nr:hypothetical protein [Bosea sp. BIWAKO-01]
MHQKPAIITICSAGKRVRQTALIADAIGKGPQATVAAQWRTTLENAATAKRADHLYRGRAFSVARELAKATGADFRVLSAGLGYVTAPTIIPTYDLTVRPSGPGSVVARIEGSFDPVGWWQDIQKGPFATNFVDDAKGRKLILLCLSRAYAEMVVSDLLQIAKANPTALRIFGLSIASALPQALQPFVMPYDERLETVGPAGTRVDFPQRALSDFVNHVLPTSLDLAAQRRGVEQRLVGARPKPSRPPQRRVDDAAVKDLILALAPAVGWRNSDMLAHLRHVAGVSCEQRRFATLFRAVKAEVCP